MELCSQRWWLILGRASGDLGLLDGQRVQYPLYSSIGSLYVGKVMVCDVRGDGVGEMVMLLSIHHYDS